MALEAQLRELAPLVLSAVLRRFRDFAAAEDAVQEALLAAALQWPKEGQPDSPRGWLIQTAFRRLTDEHRAATARRRREDEAQAEREADHLAFAREPMDEERDDTLILLFMCCHPALTEASAIALTLRAVGGLTTAEIAAAFFVPEATMAQRISRAKQTVKQSGVPFQLPSDVSRQLSSVLHVLYLVFNEGYASSSGPVLARVDLTAEAIRLTREVLRLRPNDVEVGALLALMLLTEARRPARTTATGALVPLDAQDRSLWNRELIAEGTALITATLGRGTAGPYQVQAAISALHDEAARAEDTDWPQIQALYEVLEALAPNPMVTLNKVVALAMVQGPRAGLEALQVLETDERLTGTHRLEAVRAHLLERAGDVAASIVSYRRAAERTASEPERAYLLGKAQALSSVR